MGKKKPQKLTVDTSTIDEVKSRIHKELIKKTSGWQGSIKQGLSLGTRKGLNSILTKAQTKSRAKAEEFEARKQSTKSK